MGCGCKSGKTESSSGHSHTASSSGCECTMHKQSCPEIKPVETKKCSCSSSPVCNCPAVDCSVINTDGIVPITSSEPASNKYSIEIKVKNGTKAPRQKNVYTGTAEGDTPILIMEAITREMANVVADLIKSIVSDAYVPPDIENWNFNLDFTLQEFIDFFLNDAGNATNGEGGGPLLVIPSIQRARVEYIARNVYQSFVSVYKHIIGNDISSFVICIDANSRLLQICIDNCLFYFRMIYN